MRDEYQITGPTKKVEIEIEIETAEKLAKMEDFTKLTQSEMINTALKRFVSQHKDFFPPHEVIKA
jgi:hypothetical protein